ncbi:MAG: hypothetical protein EOM14_10780 [Clostridia bacterium]|nr:hypothetical protein [Clostridia bacterium]
MRNNCKQGKAMQVYKRVFKVTSGKIIDAVVEDKAVNDLANKEYRAILEEIGAKLEYYQRDGRMCGIIFEGLPDRKVFKPLNKGWWPKKNCKAGRELCNKISAVKTVDKRDVLALVGLHGAFPRVISEGKGYYCSLVVIPEEKPVVYITVPWWDEDPDKVSAYKKRRDAGTEGNHNYDAILWEPTPDMEEVKMWELERHIDEWNSALKSERKNNEPI